MDGERVDLAAAEAAGWACLFTCTCTCTFEFKCIHVHAYEIHAHVP